MGVTVRIDLERCIGSGNCVSELPQAFTFDTAGQAEVRAGAGDIAVNTLRDIAWRCPTSAIRLYDEAGAELDALA
jgi:ferredoxin